MPVKTFFLEDTGRGQVLRWDDKGEKVIVGICSREEFGESMHGNTWCPLYRRSDTGEEMTWTDAPEGATRVTEYPPFGPDGSSLAVKCPGGETWYVDSRASNCTMKDDNAHRCWVRHGDPKLCNVTVDKNGLTCQAGAGSIQTRNWHGFLRNGMLVE